MPVDRSPRPQEILPKELTKEDSAQADVPEEISVRKKTTLLAPRGDSEAFTMANADVSLPKILSCLSLLSQFSHPQVRADFINGKFGPLIDPNILAQLDELRWILLPRWQPGSLVLPSRIMIDAANNTWKLINRSTDEVSPSEFGLLDSPSYGHWFDILESIANSKYWKDVPASDRCTHILKPDLPLSNDSFKLASYKTPKSEFVPGRKAFQDDSSNKGKSKHLCKRRVKAEEIIVLSSQSSSPSNHSSFLSCLSDDSSSSSGDMARVKKSKGRQRDSREVVTPPAFEMDGKMSLGEYLSTYELFFNGKYRGNSYDKCQKLESFLKGDLLKVYQVCGGRRLRYREMKQKLLDFYRKQKIGGKAYWRREFGCAVPDPYESLDIFGMRLLELAELAFPKSKTECATQVQHRFLESIPSHVASKIIDTERAVKATSGGRQKYLKFSALMQIARDLQDELPKKQTVMWAEDATSYSHRPTLQNTYSNQQRKFRQQGRFNSRDFRGRRPNQERPHSPSPQNQRRGSSVPRMRTSRQAVPNFCSYCRRSNHNRENCWRANDACLICGEGHNMRDCPNYDPNYGSRSRSRDLNC